MKRAADLDGNRFLRIARPIFLRGNVIDDARFLSVERLQVNACAVCDQLPENRQHRGDFILSPRASRESEVGPIRQDFVDHARA